MSISSSFKLIVFSTLLGVSAASFAQEHYVEPASDLPLGLAGETDLQRRMGNGVQTVCGQFIEADDFTETEQRADLFDRCGEMVHTINEINDIEPQSKSLGITKAELANVLQQVAGEEVLAQGSIATDTMSGQNTMINSRISGLLTRLGQENFSDGYYANNGRILGMGASGDDVGLSEDFSMFANILGGRGDKDATDSEDGFDLDTMTFIVGADYRLNNSTVVGASIGWEQYDADYTKNQRVSGGDISVDTTTVSLYGLHSQESYFMSAILGYGNSDFDTSRSLQIIGGDPGQGANRQLTSETQSNQYNLSLTMGYPIVKGTTTISPYVKLNYLEVEIDGFDEVDSTNGGLGLQFGSQNIKSVRGILGMQASWVISQDFGVLSPYIIAEWLNEFNDVPNTVTFQYIHDPRNNQIAFMSEAVDSNYFNFTVGTSLVLPNSFQLHADFSSFVGFKDFDYYSLNIGIRKAF